jgi:hypothetical protein
MSFSDLAAIGSFVSGVAIVATLIFLLIQIRQTNKNQQSLMQQGRSVRIVETLLKKTDPVLSEAIPRVYLSDLTIDATQIHAANALIEAFFTNEEASYLQHQAGLLHGSSWESDVATLRQTLMVPAWRVGWKMCRHRASEEYRAYIDSLLREVKPVKAFDEAALWKSLMIKELTAA